MRLNKKMKAMIGPRTHEGGPAVPLAPEAQLRRSVLATLLWEDQFYEEGVAIADRIELLVAQVPPETVAALAVEARETMHLRHAPLLLVSALARSGSGRPGLVAGTIEQVVQRPDELTELLAIYWRAGRRPLSAQMKKGLARAFGKFDAYQLAKYDRADAVKLRDVLFLVHAKPRDAAQAETWKALVDGTLPAPDTWEVALSGGADKRATFERLIREGRLGYLALLRNLRNMVEAGVDDTLVREAVLARKGAGRVLPFRYVAAARAAVVLDAELGQALKAAVGEQSGLAGRTIVLVDVSGSMEAPLSRRSDMTRLDAAATLAAILPGSARIFSFSNEVKEVPARGGLAGIDAIVRSQEHGGTWLGKAVEHVNALPHDRLVVVTDEQSHDKVPDPAAPHAYMVNVASARNGVGYGKWVHIDGFSEGVLRYIAEAER